MEDANNNNEEGNQTGINLTFEQLGRLTKTNPSELKEKLTKKNESGEILSNEDQFKIVSSQMSIHFKESNKEQRSRGAREALSLKRKELSELYGLENSGDINDVFSRFAEKSTPSDNPKNSDEIKRYKQKIAELSTSLSEKDKEILGIKTTYEKESIYNKVDAYAMSFIKSKGGVFSTNPSIQARQIKAQKQVLREQDWKLDDKGIPYLVDDNGEQLQNDYVDVSTEDFLLQNSVVDFKQETKGGKGYFPNTDSSGKDSSYNWSYTKEQVLKNGVEIYGQLSKKDKAEGAAFKAYHDKVFAQSQKEK